MIVLSTKGLYKNNQLRFQEEYPRYIESPYESSNTTSRYALVRSIIDNHTIFLNDELAQFASPDLSYSQNKYLSIFMPGISLLAAPLYYLGKIVKLPQLISFLLNPIFAIATFFIIISINKKLGNEVRYGVVGGMIYLFGTNALVYTQTLTQHIISTFLLLSLLNISLSKISIFKNILVGLIAGLLLLIDIPNVFIALPFGIHILLKHFKTNNKNTSKIRINLKLFAILIGLIPPMFLLLKYNQLATGSFTKIGQSLGRTTYEESIQGKPIVDVSNQSDNVYQTSGVLTSRRILRGLNVLVINKERGIIYYEPIVIIGLLGLFIQIHKTQRVRNAASTALASVVICILTYAMFGDPWGGWSFGPRYLIPVAGLLSAFSGTVIKAFRQNLLVMFTILIMFGYSTYVNLLGVITTASIPPKHEAEALIEPIPYTYKYNIDLLAANRSSNMLYNSYLNKYIDGVKFLEMYVATISGIFLILIILNGTAKKRASDLLNLR